MTQFGAKIALLTVSFASAYMLLSAHLRAPDQPASTSWEARSSLGNSPPLASPRPGCACFAPDTDPDIIALTENRLFGPRTEAYTASARWSATAHGSGGSYGTPVTLTYSFVADGMISSSSGSFPSDLYATLDGQFGSTAAWKQAFRDSFDAWGRLTGVTFIEETVDDGAAWPDSPGVLGVRGDIRIVGVTEDGPGNVLAYNYYPNTGDMAIDIAENWSAAANDHRFLRNIIMHEAGHGLGLGHVYPTDATKLMEPYLSTSFDGPQDDDTRGGAYLYNDTFESNDSAGAATDLGGYSDGMPLDPAALRDDVDEDWYFVSAAPGDRLTVTATPLGGLYYVGSSSGGTAQIDTRQVNPLTIEIYDESGTELIRHNAASAAGDLAEAAPFSVNSGDGGFHIRVFTGGDAPDVQRYQLALADSATPLRTVSIMAQSGSGTVTADPPDVHGDRSVAMPGTLTYVDGESVTLTAPEGTSPILFDRWIIDGVLQPEGQRDVTFSVGANVSAVANYGELLYVTGDSAKPIAIGESIALTARASGGQPPYSFAWSPAATLSKSTGASVVAAPAQTTIYSVTVTDSLGKQASVSMTVEVVDVLSVDAGSDLEFIAGAPANLHAAPAGGVPPYSYAWTPTGFGVAANGANYVPSLEDATTFSVTVMDGDGRSASDSVYVSVTPRLTVSIGDQMWVTLNETVQLSAAVGGGEPPYEYEWYHNGLLMQAGGATLPVQTQASTAYLVVVRDASGQERSDSVHLSVVDPLEASIGAASRDLNSRQAMMLIARADGGASPYRFIWSPSDWLDKTDSAVVTARPDFTTTFTVTVLDATHRSTTAEITLNVAEVSGVTAENPSDEPAGEQPEIVPVAPIGLCGFGIVSAAPLTALLIAPLRVRSRRRT